MNAMIEPTAFQLPKKPRIKEKEAPPDQRKVAVLPFKAVFDENITPGALHVLAAICAYCNRAGITWVSQNRLATELKVSRQAVTNQIAQLRKHGYVEIMKKGYMGQRCNTLRVIFDATVDAETAMAITSRYEDTRPPAIKEEQDRQMNQEIDKEGQQRIAQMIAKAIKQPIKPKGYTMPTKGETRTVKKMKDEIAQAKAKRSKSPSKTSDTIGHSPVSIDVQSTVSSKDSIGHSTVSSVETQECPLTRIEHIEDKVKDKDKEEINNKPNVLGNLEVSDFDFLIDKGMEPLEIEYCAKNLLPLFAAEGIKPSSRVLTDAILQLHLDAGR
jgi:biotin operon repressor